MITYEEFSEYGAKIRIVGVGGGGCNAVNAMIDSKLVGVEFVAINTDIQSLGMNKAQHKIQIGKSITRGLGAGANPDIGKRAAEEDLEDIKAVLDGSDLVFITCGMGGGTGTGASSIIAEVAKSMGALTIGIVTKPFRFEQPKRMKLAQIGVDALRQYVDTLIAIPNEKLLTIMPKNTPFIEAFKAADDVLFRATKGISDLISNSGYVNVDFADVRKIMINAGDAIMGIGVGSGENRGEMAVRQAINSPLLEDTNIEGATGILLNLVCPLDFTTEEVDQICHLITSVAHDETDVIWGYAIDPNLKDEVHVTVIASGIGRASDVPLDASAPNLMGSGQLSITKRSTKTAKYYEDIKKNDYSELEKPAIQRMEEDEDLKEELVFKKTGTDVHEAPEIPIFFKHHGKFKK